VGGAMRLDGVNDYMQTLETLTVDTGQPRTVAAWVKLESTGVGRGVVALVNVPTPWTVFPMSAMLLNHADALSTVGVFAFYNGRPNPADVVTTNASTIALNTWYHLVGVVENNTVRLYVNGSQAGTTVYDGNLPPTTITAPVTLGRHWHTAAWGWRYLHGLIDDVRIYDRALTEAEIQALANP
jgi:hypothetical protein